MKKIFFYTTIVFLILICQQPFCQVLNNDFSALDKPVDRFPEHDDIYKGKVLPETLHPSYHPSHNSLNTEFGEGANNLDVQDIFRMSSGKSSPIFGPTIGELEKNKRYDFYKPGVNYEDIYARSQNNSLLYVFLFIILIIVIVIIRPTFLNKNTKTISENKTVTINGGNNKEKDLTKILTELKKLQSLRKTGAITEEEFENLKKGILS